MNRPVERSSQDAGAPATGPACFEGSPHRAAPDPGAPVFIAGPTAAGKSEIALRLAEHLGGEIISVDSMQVYRGLDIGTAKPSPAERARVPHHLVDVMDLDETFDAARFIILARKAVAEIQSRHHVPIFCGGTGLYFKAFVAGLGGAPPSDPKLRAELEAAPLAELLRELAERDPETCGKIDRQNPRRVIRAVEVIRLTGKPFSEQRARWGGTPGEPSGAAGMSDSPGVSPHQGESTLGLLARRSGAETARPPACFLGLRRSSSELRDRIDARVDDMFRRGLVAETEHLLKLGLADNKTALQALGYRQVVEHLQGKRSLAETVELVKIRTRQFAKRQMTWFRRQPGLEWIEIKPEHSPGSVAALVKARFERIR
jgi:tRNA dimethylallyltransferase